MNKIESYVPGSFCWAELVTSDLAEAKRFYSEMFGFTAVDNTMPEGLYTIFQSDGNNACAAYQGKPGVPSQWSAYFTVANVDASAARVAELGGGVIAGPFDAHEAGRMVIVQDPQGAALGLWQPKMAIGATHPGPLNQFCWPELHTTDPASAAAFYSGLFGWRTQPDTGIGEAQYIEWINGETHIGGAMPMRGPMWEGVPPHWMLYVTVADCDERSAKAAELGANVCVPPTDIPNVGRFSVITDPQGAAVSLVQMARTTVNAAA